MCVFIFSTNLSVTFLILRTTTRPALQSVCMFFIPGNLRVLSGGRIIL